MSSKALINHPWPKNKNHWKSMPKLSKRLSKYNNQKKNLSSRILRIQLILLVQLYFNKKKDKFNYEWLIKQRSIVLKVYVKF